MKSNQNAGVLISAAALLLAASACNNVSTSVLVEHVAAPSGGMGCTFEEDGNDFFSETTLNTNEQLSLRLRARARNVMAAEPIPVQNTPEEELALPNRVTPVRFDFRWECESNGFTGNLGPFILPQFSLSQPFCLNDREEVGDFVGFDAVAASGSTIEPDTRGIMTFQPIPSQLGIAFDEFFQLATLANACCAENCNDVAGAPMGPQQPCTELQGLFDRVSGGALSARVPADVLRWQPYSIYDGSAAPKVPFATFPLRLRGRFEFITGGGDMVTSNELIHNVNICKNCDANTTPCTAQ